MQATLSMAVDGNVMDDVVYRAAKGHLRFIKEGGAEQNPMEDAKPWHRSLAYTGRDKILRSIDVVVLIVRD
jgi:hypothetical protein